MALFRCKMCGGDLEITADKSIAICQYCDTKQTVPKAMDENLQPLFNRANTLRIKGEFDKAGELYEKIIQANAAQSEAYWGLILCKYGIEYVDDPVTYKKIPTCHRASYDSIIADNDYQAAIKYADKNQRPLYEEQAKEIDRIQKDILALAQKAESYDVFICYKETDAKGQRTQDSVIANDIYYQLTQEGFKVFYAAITLEGKLGSAYEPIIFAALHSAKIMLSIGTKPEYFNAVWVKNEWSRFLKIMKQDRSKLLIPCYRDMDAYELPEEFAHLQAQDMSKIGFINDIVRGINKVIVKDESKLTVKKEAVNNINGIPTSVNIAPLLKRTVMCLEDGDFDRADALCEQILNQDPENAQAYVYKLMLDLKVRKQEDLKNCDKPFHENNNYRKAIRFADDSLRQTLTEYTEHVCLQTRSAILAAAKEKIQENTLVACEEASVLLNSIAGWKDADELILSLQDKIKELKRLSEQQALLAVTARKKAEQRTKKRKTIAIIVTAIVSIAILSLLIRLAVIPYIKYNQALILKSSGQSFEAMAAFEELGHYRDSSSQLQSLKIDTYRKAVKAWEQKDYQTAVSIFEKMDGYMNSNDMLHLKKLESEGNYQDAATMAQKIGLMDATYYKKVANGEYKYLVTYFKHTDIVLPNNTKSLGYAAFSNMETIQSVTIPVSVTTIDRYAFRDCENLTNIYYKGTKAQWEKISKVGGWDQGTGNYTVHCTDGTI